MMSNFKYTTLITITYMLCTLSTWAQNIKGRVIDAVDQQPMEHVLVQNIHTGEKLYTNEKGEFALSGSKEQLIEISDFGYKTVRLRLYDNPQKFFEVKMYVQPFEFNEVVVFDNNPNRKIDSIQTAEIFRKALNFKKLDGIESIKHPLSALSKHNKRIWDFQERYFQMEKEKFIEYTFNDDLIHQLTNLGSDSMALYKIKFRPQYEWFEYWNNYEFYQYIKKTVTLFRRNSRYYNLQNQ